MTSIVTTQKNKVMNKWKCNGDGKVNHPLVENEKYQCQFENCTRTRRTRDNKSLYYLLGIGILLIISFSLLLNRSKNGERKKVGEIPVVKLLSCDRFASEKCT
jgi:hypothetical protein